MVKKVKKVIERISIPVGTIASFIDYDGRYSSTATPVRIVSFNEGHHEYLVEFMDGTWEVVSERDLVTFDSKSKV